VSEKKMKVTDKRLFTSEGELKNEFRHLEDQAPAEPTADVEPPTVEPPVEEPEPRQVDEQMADRSEAETPPTGRGYVSPTFFDLVGVVAQPIALYLGDAKMPDGESLENLELARLYIDLLEVLYKKSAGNVTPEEGEFLKDLLYQLRLRFVEKSS
jgi:hypothetical protein